jgi:hypothetical protein
LQFVERPPGDYEKPRKLNVTAPESLRDVSAHRIDSVVGLALRLEISSEGGSCGQLERFDSDLVCDLPDIEFGKVPRSAHGQPMSTNPADHEYVGFSYGRELKSQELRSETSRKSQKLRERAA